MTIALSHDYTCVPHKLFDFIKTYSTTDKP